MELRYLTYKSIELIDVCKNLSDFDGKNGSLITFSGIVRSDEVNGAFVKKIIYEAYIPLAEKRMQRIEEKALEKFSVKKIYIKHRIGEVLVGEVALFVAVFSAHREVGFLSIQFIIDEIKRRVPIWKKEVLSNGVERWVEPNLTYD